MRKNKSIIHTYFVLAFLLALFVMVPGSLLAQESTEGQEQEAVKTIPLLPLEMGFWKFFFNTFPGLFLQLLPAAAAAALIKTWLLKRKLSIPWNWNPVEKLSLAVLAETLVEILFLFLFVAFFAFALSSFLTDQGIIFADSVGGQTLRFIAYTAVALPYHCFISALLILALIHLVMPLKKDEQRQYYRYGAFLALITPVLLVVFIVVGRMLFKWNYI